MDQSSKPRPFVRPFSEARSYEQEEPGQATFHFLLEQDELPGLCMGRVILEGPIHKTPAAHDTWHQAYLVLSGSGTVHLGGESHRIQGPSVVSIPANTLHSVELREGERLEYVYVNQFRL